MILLLPYEKVVQMERKLHLGPTLKRWQEGKRGLRFLIRIPVTTRSYPWQDGVTETERETRYKL
jgi:hypothetical protein